jgi:hypothetical protein
LYCGCSRLKYYAIFRHCVKRRLLPHIQELLRGHRESLSPAHDAKAPSELRMPGISQIGTLAIRGFDRDVEMQDFFADSKLLVKSNGGDVAVIGLNINDPDAALYGNRS